MAKSKLHCHTTKLEINHEEPNEVTYDAMEAVENEVELHGPFNSVEEFIESLNK